MSNLDDFSESIIKPQHRKFFDYWRSKAPPGLLPGRQHLDPLEIPEMLPSIALYDVVRDGERMRIRFRLVGSNLVERYGRDATGMWFDDAFEGKIRDEQIEHYCSIARRAEPSFTRNILPIKGKEHIDYDRLILPLASDGELVDMLVAMMLFDDKP